MKKRFIPFSQNLSHFLSAAYVEASQPPRCCRRCGEGIALTFRDDWPGKSDGGSAYKFAGQCWIGDARGTPSSGPRFFFLPRFAAARRPSYFTWT